MKWSKDVPVDDRWTGPRFKGGKDGFNDVHADTPLCFEGRSTDMRGPMEAVVSQERVVSRNGFCLKDVQGEAGQLP